MFLRFASRFLSNTGYTFVELMVVLVVSGILVVLSVPSFTAQTSRRSLRRTSHKIVSQLRLIRQKAITEGKTLSIQFSPDSRQYDLPGYGEQTLPQMILFGASDEIHKIPKDRDGTPPVDGVSFTDNEVKFQPNGTYAGLGGSIYITNDSPQRETMAITVNMTGRVRLYKWSGDEWE
ncbi:MAG: GspH/FimT family pseudopilin [Nitrospira sp.]|nr:prepilin-type N-terminal cleavage/methylation domain-containing protein [Candidatus Manganitrophaceae bacterium]HIL34577.1 prepilin-type N-terminal cleavage/methylation domain-containing protein [Candidatus Manganitrophaceae bacterium]